MRNRLYALGLGLVWLAGCSSEPLPRPPRGKARRDDKSKVPGKSDRQPSRTSEIGTTEESAFETESDAALDEDQQLSGCSEQSVVDVTRRGIDATGKRDVTLALQKIIDANAGKTIYLPSGTYLIDPSQGLSIPSGTELKGVGWGATEIVAADAGDGTLIAAADGTNDVVIRDIRIVLRGDKQTGIALTNTTKALVERCYVTPQDRAQEWYNAPNTCMGVGIRIGVIDSNSSAECCIKDTIVLFTVEAIRVSGGEGHLIEHCDLLEGHVLINVPSTAVRNLTIHSSTIQYVRLRNSFAVDLMGKDCKIIGCYFEVTSAASAAILLRDGNKSNYLACNVYMDDKGVIENGGNNVFI